MTDAPKTERDETSVPATDPAPPGATPPPRRIARQLAVAFGSISVVAIAMCAMLLLLINQVSGLVMGMREDEGAIRQSLELATAVREQTIRVAQFLVEPSAEQLASYDRWRGRVRTGIQQVAGAVPEEERWRIQVLAEKTQQVHDRFLQSAVPAAERGDRERALEEHRTIARLAEEASTQADALARAVESRMAHSHVLATESARLGLLVGGACILLVLLLSVGFTLRLREAVLKPLTLLTEAARRFGNGDFGARVGSVGAGELEALGNAFDSMAEEIVERERRLVGQERMAAIGQLAAGVAHELNNPIGIIRGYLKTMGPETEAEALREELQILDEEASHCQRIAEDLLAFARTSELDLERIWVGAFLEETVRRFRESPKAEGVSLVVEAEEAELSADPTRLRQVLLNLILNAVQASPKGGVVDVRGCSKHEGYVIEVLDRGPGVGPEDRQRVFEPFYSKRRGGSGLGLSVCQGIVRAHGGQIVAEEREGGGARFLLELPPASELREATGEDRR